MRGLVEQVDRRGKKPWITQEVIVKIYERRQWNNVTKEVERKDYRRLRNKLKRGIGKAKKEYLESMSNEITEFQRTGRCYLMYIRTKELSWEKNLWIQNPDTEDSQRKITVDRDKY
jgi:hypothetical protein